MDRRTPTRLLAASLVLAVITAGVGWALYFREKQRTDDLASRVVLLESDVTAFRETREAAKVEQAKVEQVRIEMRVIEQAYKKYYTEHGRWPENIQQITSQLESGQAGLIDPWGQMYTVQIVDVRQSDGETVQRPVVTCQPPGGKPAVRWPEKLH
jgi:hypothetical protein